MVGDYEPLFFDGADLRDSQSIGDIYWQLKYFVPLVGGLPCLFQPLTLALVLFLLVLVRYNTKEYDTI